VSAEVVLFWLFGICTVASALVVVGAKNPMGSAMALVATFFFLAGIYVLLLAHTIAVLQILVYAGAVMVLFLFVIMLLSLTGDERHSAPTLMKVLGGAVAAALSGLLGSVFRQWIDVPPASSPAQLNAGSLHAVGALLYTQWLFPFEAVSLLLLVAIVGAVVVAKAKI